MVIQTKIFIPVLQDTYMQIFESPLSDPFRIVGLVTVRDSKLQYRELALISRLDGPHIPPGRYRIKAIPPSVPYQEETMQEIQIDNHGAKGPYQNWPFVLFMRSPDEVDPSARIW